MMHDEAMIERIVQAVLVRLEGEAASAQCAGTAPSSTLRVAQRVVTADSLLEALDGVADVEVPAGAVVTPSARDILRGRGVGLRFAEPSSQGTRDQKLLLAVVESSVDLDSISRQLQRAGLAWQAVPNVGLAAVVHEIAREVHLGGHLGAILTNRVHAACCLANRWRGVRAGVVHAASDVASALQQIGINCLISPPRGRSTHELVAILRAFTAADRARGCPVSWDAWD